MFRTLKIRLSSMNKSKTSLAFHEEGQNARANLEVVVVPVKAVGVGSDLTQVDELWCGAQAG